MGKELVAIHAWEPGLFSNDPPTSSAGAQWWRHLIDVLSNDYMFIWANSQDKIAPDGFTHVSKCGVKNWDLAVFAWRWLLAPQYIQRNVLHTQQMELIGECVNHHVPIIILDHDDMIETTEFGYLKAIGARIMAPELRPRYGVETLMFPDMLHMALPNPPSFSDRQYDLVYVGNNYERFNQAVAYLSLASLDKSTKFWGNWLETNPSRTSPTTVVTMLPNIKFDGRLQQDKILTALSDGMTTIHLHKPSYGPIGFLSLRWYEAVCAYTPAWVPSEFYLPPLWQERMMKAIIHDGLELASKFAYWKQEDYQEVLEVQRTFCKEVFVTERWPEVFEDSIKSR